MGKSIACMLGMSALLCLGQTPTTAAKPNDEKCVIEGRVVNSIGGDAVRRALLVLGTGDARSIQVKRSTESDDSGRFVLRDIDPGRYVLRAERAGFVGQVYGARPISGAPVPLILSAGQHLKDLVFRMVPSAVISGRVFDSENEPIRGIRVTALRAAFQRGERVWEPRGSAQTNDLGEFRIADLTAGSYVVAATPGMTLRNLLEPGENRRTTDIPTFHPSAADASGAMPVPVRAGEESGMTDIRVLRVATVSVSGKVTGDTGGNGITVRLAQRDGGLGLLAQEKQTTAQLTDGSFVLASVVPGSYTLVAMSSDGGTTVGAQPLLVGEQDIEGIELPLSPRGDLSGAVTVEGNGSARLENILVMLRPRGYGVSNPPRAYTDGGGRFTIKGLTAGRYSVEVANTPEGAYVKSIRLGSHEIQGSGLDLTGGVTGFLQIALSTDSARVDGVVLDAEGRPVAGATVALIPASRAHLDYHRAYSDQRGGFSLAGVAPGDYQVLAWEDIEEGAYEDPEILKRLADRAESVSLKQNDRRTLQVTAIPVAQVH